MKLFLAFLFSIIVVSAKPQDINSLLKDADTFEKQQKEADAIEKYKQVLVLDPAQLKALVKLTELNVLIGNTQTEKSGKRLYYETALSFAKRAIEANSGSADANYAMALASGKMTDVETDNKKIVAFVKDAKQYAETALSINPNFGKANYALGKWHYEMTNLSGLKKVAVKLFYGGLPDGKIELAIQYMEKCKSLEPYFVANYLDLAKAYKDDHKPSQAIEVLNRLVKLPTRTSEDPALKAEGAKLLDSLQ
jgi:tetratricopeptide (TPR) repeat protein